MSSYEEKFSNHIENKEQVTYPVTLDTRRVASKPENSYQNSITSNVKTYKYTIYPYPIHSKPSGEFKQKIDGRISNGMNQVVNTTINEFTQNVILQAYPYSCGLFKGHINDTSWYIQYLISLDFDKGKLTVDEVYERFKEFDIVPQVVYETYGSMHKLNLPRHPNKIQKFRVVMFLDYPITTEEQRIHIVEGLLSIFPEADDQCMNAGRWYYPGKHSYITTDEPVRLQNLVDFVGTKVMNLKDKQNSWNLPLDTYHSSTSDEGKKWYFLLEYNKNNKNFPYNIPTSTMKGVNSERIDWDKARKEVKILDDFLNGIQLTHNQFHGLATNLFYVSGGFKKMRQTMSWYNEEGITSYSKDKFKHLQYLTRAEYPPKPIRQFSPHEDDNIHFDLITASKEKRGKINFLKPIERISLNEGEKVLSDSLNNFLLNAKKGKITVLLLPTAIGKTKLLETLNNVIIAVPTNALKNEVKQRMKVDSVITPDTIVFKSNYINNKTSYFYLIGEHSKATAFLYDIILPQNATRFLPDDIEKANEYLNQLEQCKTSDKTIITTHPRALHNEFKHDTIIFDEDPLNQLIDIKKLKISDLHKLNMNAENINGSELDKLIEYLTGLESNTIYDSKTFDINIEDYANNVYSKGLTSNVFEYFSSSFIIRNDGDKDEIFYVVKHDIPENKKIAIMSATAPLFIYEKLFGDRLEVVNLTDIEHVGEIIQYTKRSCSRNGLDDYGETIGKLVGDKPVLTMKDYKKYFTNPIYNMHFGNCEGYDEYNGKDMAVVGTPHRNNLEYYLVASAIGHKFEIDHGNMMDDQWVQYNDFEFKFMSFQDEILRNIQFSLIEGDMLQAVGRARTLRKPAKVELYSNFPLRCTSRFDWN